MRVEAGHVIWVGAFEVNVRVNVLVQVVTFLSLFHFLFLLLPHSLCPLLPTLFFSVFTSQLVLLNSFVSAFFQVMRL